MKQRRARSSVPQLLQSLRRSELLTAKEMDELEQRWQGEAKQAEDSAEFTRWVVQARYVTAYQMTMLAHGRLDHFFLGEYKLLERIGKGKLAKVFKAVDRLGEVVAIKVLPPSRARDAQGLARYQREVRLCQRLHHPHVVRFLDAGVAGPLHFLVMEYLEGETLQQMLARRRQLSPRETIPIGLQTLAGLQHLHDLGIVHRNLEPGNLLLVRPGPGNDANAVKIVDFSLARSLVEEVTTAENDRGDAEELQLIVPTYVAPELIRNPGQHDLRSDLYSLGCILYHCLAGQPPSAEAATAGPPLLDQVNPEVSPELARVIARLMRQAASERYASPAEASEALQAIPSHEEVPTVNVEVLAWPEQVPDTATPSSYTVVSTEPERPAQQQFRSPEGFDRRDWLLLLLGAASLLFVQGLSWALARLGSLLRRQRGSE